MTARLTRVPEARRTEKGRADGRPAGSLPAEAASLAESFDHAEEPVAIASIPPTPMPARAEAMLTPDEVTFGPTGESREPERAADVQVRPAGQRLEIKAPAAATRLGSRFPDAAVLSDMARHLEQALKHAAPSAPADLTPASAARLSDTTSAPAGDFSPRPPEDKRDLRPGTAAAPHSDPVVPPGRMAAPVLPLTTRSATPAPRRTLDPPRGPAPPTTSAPGETPESPSTQAPDPFSVEGIEAEFARLLGRS
jgi:hypothetical protein